MDEKKSKPRVKELFITTILLLIGFIISFFIFKYLNDFNNIIFKYIALIFDLVGELLLVLLIFSAVITIVFIGDKLIAH